MFELLRNDIDKKRRKKSYTVQLDPAILDPDAFEDDVDGAKRETVLSYVEKLMKSREANVYWGTAADFCHDLMERYDA
jgi:serine/threonine-protein kinase RIO1